jgi:hypothetical protein
VAIFIPLFQTMQSKNYTCKFTVAFYILYVTLVIDIIPCFPITPSASPMSHSVIMFLKQGWPTQIGLRVAIWKVDKNIDFLGYILTKNRGNTTRVCHPCFEVFLSDFPTFISISFFFLYFIAFLSQLKQFLQTQERFQTCRFSDKLFVSWK